MNHYVYFDRSSRAIKFDGYFSASDGATSRGELGPEPGTYLEGPYVRAGATLVFQLFLELLQPHIADIWLASENTNYCTLKQGGEIIADGSTGPLFFDDMFLAPGNYSLVCAALLGVDARSPGGDIPAQSRSSDATFQYAMSLVPQVPVPIRVYFQDESDLTWTAELDETSWNVYRGDLDTLRATGIYTQAPGSNPVAARFCGASGAQLNDPFIPDPGQASFWLVTPIVNGVEGDLGVDSNQAPRVNSNPCP